MSRAIKNSRLVILPEVGHFPNVESPDAYSEAIMNFLDGTK